MLEALLFVRDIELVQSLAVDLILEVAPTHLFYLSLAEITRKETPHESAFSFNFLLLQLEPTLAEIEFQILIFAISGRSIADM